VARKVGQIIARRDRGWLIRVYLGKRNHHNRTIHGSVREAQAYLTRKLRFPIIAILVGCCPSYIQWMRH
jgi:hypothetical protein